MSPLQCYQSVHITSRRLGTKNSVSRMHESRYKATLHSKNKGNQHLRIPALQLENKCRAEAKITTIGKQKTKVNKLHPPADPPIIAFSVYQSSTICSGTSVRSSPFLRSILLPPQSVHRLFTKLLFRYLPYLSSSSLPSSAWASSSATLDLADSSTRPGSFPLFRFSDVGLDGEASS